MVYRSMVWMYGCMDVRSMADRRRQASRCRLGRRIILLSRATLAEWATSCTPYSNSTVQYSTVLEKATFKIDTWFLPCAHSRGQCDRKTNGPKPEQISRILIIIIMIIMIIMPCLRHSSCRTRTNPIPVCILRLFLLFRPSFHPFK